MTLSVPTISASLLILIFFNLSNSTNQINGYCWPVYMGLSTLPISRDYFAQIAILPKYLPLVRRCGDRLYNLALLLNKTILIAFSTINVLSVVDHYAPLSVVL